MRVVIEPGHSGPGQSGVTGERAWVSDLALMLCERLAAVGVVCDVVVSWRNSGPAPAAATAAADLFLALHYDFPGAVTGYKAAAPDADLDAADSTSRRFVDLWTQRYAALGIPHRPTQITANMRRYYAWRDVHPQTPKAILEFGSGHGQDEPILFGRKAEVADVTTAAILEFLGVTNVVTLPKEAQTMALLNDVQTAAAMRMLGLNPAAATHQRWLLELRKGNFLGWTDGRAEISLPQENGSTITLQQFTGGVITWDGQETSLDL